MKRGFPTSLSESLHYLCTVPPLSSQKWSQLSDSHCITAASQRLQTPSNSTVYARSPVKSGFQRPLKKSRTILPVAIQNFPTLLPVSIYWSFYWRRSEE